ncbi:MAG: hypothetical protein ACK41D_02060 [Rubricoccaceae bacterium]
MTSALRPALALAACTVLLGLGAAPAQAQFQNRWLAAGSFQNWYSSAGSECESCFLRTQQYGWRWPGIYQFTDTQAAKGMWIGARNVRDAAGNTFPVRVVHVGPRVRGAGEVFPTAFEIVTRYEMPVVTVDGDQSFPEAEMISDRVDPDLPADAMLVSRINTLLGLTVERRVYAFSQQYHDNYHIIEYVLTNTGNTNDDPTIELPNQTLEDVMFYLQWRMAVSRETRYVIANSTGWGKHTMNDARGDGLLPDPPGEEFRAQFAWHGRSAEFNGGYDNVGGPIQRAALNVAAADTLGRLGSSQFVGVVTLHADTAPGNPADDRSQPSTMNYVHSDDPLTSNNDAFNNVKMQQEYNLMTQGRRPRHAFQVEPSGLPGFLAPTGDPSLGTSGGFSFAQGYGPYTLAPGESVRIVVAEAAAGLSREANKAIGRAFKNSGNNRAAPIPFTVNGQTFTKTKNEWVFTSRDSLFQTFRRALDNYNAGFAIPRGPAPPRTLSVNSGGDRISLEWTPFPDAPPFDGWEVYRAQARFDSTYTLVHAAGPGTTRFDDTTPVRGVDYYYYVVAVQNGSANPGGGGTPAGRPLRSSRYFAQTYSPARLQRPQGRSMEDIRVVPNPYYIGADRLGAGGVRFPDRNDKLAFYNIPGQCRIEIYTELGELVDTIVHTDGSGDAIWDHTTSSRQVIASGIYIAVITVTEDIQDANGALLFRAGDRTFRKFAVIR